MRLEPIALQGGAAMNYDHEKHLLDIGPLSHEPIIPPRDGHVGELVYSTAWRIQMETAPEECAAPNARLQDILYLMGPLTQRQATVAATFVMWLGTNVGLGFVSACKMAISSSTLTPYRAWLEQWGWTNRRQSYLNYGLRSIELILAPAELYCAGQHGIGGLSRAPDLSADDYETVEHLLEWLSGTEGGEFLSACDAEIEARRVGEHLRRRLEATRPAVQP